MAASVRGGLHAGCHCPDTSRSLRVLGWGSVSAGQVNQWMCTPMSVLTVSLRAVLAEARFDVPLPPLASHM
jgi:hypothetical protein